MLDPRIRPLVRGSVHGNRHRRSGADGRRHGAAPRARRRARGVLRPGGAGAQGARRRARTSKARRTWPRCARGSRGERVIVLSLPAGAAVEDTIRDLLPLLLRRRHDGRLRQQLLPRLDAPRARAVAAGPALHRRRASAAASTASQDGYCLMLGGTPKSIEIFEPFAARCSRPRPSAAGCTAARAAPGHFAKMIHNGIEYGMMQSLAEGFALLAARQELDIDVGAPRRDLAPRQRGALVAARSVREILKDNEDLSERRAGGGRLRRRPLDRARVDRARRARAGDHRGADEPLLQPGPLGLRAAPARHDARSASAATPSRRSPRAGMIVLVMGVAGVRQDDDRRGARARARLARSSMPTTTTRRRTSPR